MSDAKYFADSFNYYLFDGRQVIKPEKLQPLDPTEMAIIPKESSGDTVEKIRDILKQCILMADDYVTYLLLGIENQTDVHYAMPVRNMIYDALNYGKQVVEKARQHRKRKDVKGSGEFLSGFTKEDKLKPLITLTIYFGSEDWDGPRSLKEMFEEMDENVLRFVEDYKVHLIVPKEIRDFGKFRTDFGKAMQYLSAASDKNKLWQLRDNPEFRTVDAATVELLNACTQSKIMIKEDEQVNVCKGVEGIREDGRREGISLTKEVYRLERSGKTWEEISQECGITIEEVEEILK